MLEIFFAAGVGNVFTKNGDALVAQHFVGERGRDHFHHGFWRAVKLRLSFECSGGGIHVRRINAYANRIDGGLGGGESLIGRVADFAVDLRFQVFNLLLIQQAFANEKKREFGKRVAVRFALRALRETCRAFRHRIASVNTGA